MIAPREDRMRLTIHTPEFDLDERALPLGASTLATLAWDFLAGAR